MKNYLRDQKTVFAFNIWDMNSAKAVIDAAAEKKENIILQMKIVFLIMRKRVK